MIVILIDRILNFNATLINDISNMNVTLGRGNFRSSFTISRDQFGLEYFACRGPALNSNVFIRVLGILDRRVTYLRLIKFLRFRS